MEYHEVINGRRSTRGFLEKPVPMEVLKEVIDCLLYTSPSPRDQRGSRMPSSA